LHGRSELGQVHVVVATDVHSTSLASVELSDDLSLVGAEVLGESREFFVFLGESFSPVKGKVVVGSSVIGLSSFTARSLVLIKPSDNSRVESRPEQGGSSVTLSSEMLESSSGGKVLTKGIPT